MGAKVRPVSAVFEVPADDPQAVADVGVVAGGGGGESAFEEVDSPLWASKA